MKWLARIAWLVVGAILALGVVVLADARYEYTGPMLVTPEVAAFISGSSVQTGGVQQLAEAIRSREAAGWEPYRSTCISERNASPGTGTCAIELVYLRRSRWRL